MLYFFLTSFAFASNVPKPSGKPSPAALSAQHSPALVVGKKTAHMPVQKLAPKPAPKVVSSSSTEPAGDVVQRDTPFKRMQDRFGSRWKIPAFKEKGEAGWPVNISYVQRNGESSEEEFELPNSSSALSSSSPTTQDHFYKQFKEDVSGVFFALERYLDKYQLPKRETKDQLWKLQYVQRFFAWGGKLIAAVLAGTSGNTDGSGFAPAFYTGIATSLIADSLEALSVRWKSLLDEAFKQRKEADEALSTILLRYNSKSEHEPVLWVFIRIICNTLGYTSAQKFKDKLPSSWTAGLHLNFPNFVPDHAAVAIKVAAAEQEES